MDDRQDSKRSTAANGRWAVTGPAHAGFVLRLTLACSVLAGSVLAGVVTQAPAAASERPVAAPDGQLQAPGIAGDAASGGRVERDGWKVAPIFGADVRSLAIHPVRPDLIFAGTAAGHLYRSDDGGHSWRDAGPGHGLAGWVVGTLLFDPNRPDRLWAAFWGVWGGGMVAYSDSLGDDWTFLNQQLDAGQIYSLALVPSRPGWLYTGTRQGVYGSRNGGESWVFLTGAIPDMGKVTSLMVPEGAPETIYAGSWQRAYRSDDGGATWRGVFEGMLLDSEVFSLVQVPGRPTEIWASTCGWVYRTVDGGGRWTRYREGMTTRRTPSFAVLSGGRLLAGTTGGLFISDDGGASWQRRTGGGLAVNAIAHHPQRPGEVLLGTEGSGVWRSSDGAATFGQAADGMTSVHVEALAMHDGELLAAVNHAGPASGIYASLDGGASFRQQEKLPTILSLARTGDRFYAATESGLYERPPGLGWQVVTELGEQRVDEVATAEDRVVALTANGLYERRDGRFEEHPFAGRQPRAAALAGGSLWVSDGQGLYRLEGGEGLISPAAPPSTGQIVPFGGEGLALAGDSGLWRRRSATSLWVRVSEEPTRLLATGDPLLPLLRLDGAGARLLDNAGEVALAVALDVPPREVEAALLVGDRLYVGTAGHGLHHRDIDRSTATAQAATR